MSLNQFFYNIAAKIVNKRETTFICDDEIKFTFIHSTNKPILSALIFFTLLEKFWRDISRQTFNITI